MGNREGHVLSGIAFVIGGLWRLFKHTKLHAQTPNSYLAHPWFPIHKFKYLELYLIMAGSSISISMELFVTPHRHQPLDLDGTIPSNHLRNFEHASISMTTFAYAALAIALDKVGAKARFGLTYLGESLVFGQMLLAFHFHSSDHAGAEGQYHLLLQCVIVVGLATALLGIGLPGSFIVSFVRYSALFFEGIWTVVMGYVLWTPSIIPKGCFLNIEEGHEVVRCSDEAALHRAKALANILFSYLLILVTVLVVGFYLVLHQIYGQKDYYTSLLSTTNEEDDGDDQKVSSTDDVESMKKNPKSFIQMGTRWGDDVEGFIEIRE